MSKKLFIYGRGCYIKDHYLHNNKQKVYLKDVCEERDNEEIDFNTKYYRKLTGKINDYAIKFNELNISEIIGGFNNYGIYSQDHKRAFNIENGTYLLSQVIHYFYDNYDFNEFYLSVCFKKQCYELSMPHISIFKPVSLMNTRYYTPNSNNKKNRKTKLRKLKNTITKKARNLED
jgi:hypothetical protein